MSECRHDPAARVARNAGREVVGDLERRDHPDFETLLGLVGHVVVSAPFAYELTGEAEAGRAAEVLARGRKAAVVTRGSEGCWAAEGESVRHYPAFAVAVADTIGCGDVFHGAYAAGLARGMDLHSRTILASAAAALKAEAGGGVAGFHTCRVTEFLEGRGGISEGYPLSLDRSLLSAAGARRPATAPDGLAEEVFDLSLTLRSSSAAILCTSSKRSC